MSDRRPLFMNGRVLLRGDGGVKRYATEVASRLEACTVVRPRSARHAWSARGWEQTNLARAAADGVLLNLAHSGPLSHPRHIFVVHDLFALEYSNALNPAYVQLFRRHVPALVRSARRVVTVSRSVAAQVADRFEIDHADIIVAEPGISSAFVPDDKPGARHTLGLRPDQPVVAALLDPTPRKNSNQVAAVLQQLRRDRPEVQVVVAGRCRPSAFARTRPRHRVTDRSGFHDLGQTSDADLANMYQSADVFLSLSSSEGFGLPPVEAAACGTAVVSTAVPSVTERCPSAVTVVDDALAAYGAVRQLLDEPQQRADLAGAARSAVASLTWHRTSRILEHTAEELQVQ